MRVDFNLVLVTYTMFEERTLIYSEQAMNLWDHLAKIFVGASQKSKACFVKEIIHFNNYWHQDVEEIDVADSIILATHWLHDG